MHSELDEPKSGVLRMHSSEFSLKVNLEGETRDDGVQQPMEL